MKDSFKNFLLLAFASILFWGCKKDEIKAIFHGGTPPVLTSSSPTVNMTAADSLRTVVTFKWTDPAYSFSTGRSTLDVIYSLEIDSIGKNFSKPQTINLENVLQETSTKLLVKSFTGKEFNDLLLKLGLTPGTSYQIEARIKAAFYSELSRLTSDVITMTVTPYSVKPIPKIPPPENLYIVGDATAGGWANPVPVPEQQLTKIDENTFGTIIELIANKHYLFLPNNGDWSSKYAVPDNSKEEAKSGGIFIANSGQDFPSPNVTGLYKIIVDFLKAEYTVTPVAPGDIPENLFIVGSATAGDWGNPVPVPSQQFTKTNAYTFELTIPLIGGKEYLLLPRNGEWSKYSVDDNSIPSLKMGGTFKAEAPDNIPGPDESGTYKIVVSFLNNQYTLTKL